MKKKSKVELNIELDEHFLPEHISWNADDAGEGGETKAFMLSLWDPKENNTLRIDLWTKDMLVDDMKKFFHQTILTMSDTLERATNEKEISEDMRDFAKYFAERMGIMAIPKKDIGKN